MSISKLTVKIAHALADYLSIDNPAVLPAGYLYGADNSAVLNPYTATNISQKAVGLAASAAMKVAQYSYSFWAAPSVTPSPFSYTTPAASNLLSVPGVDGLDRAIQMARHFGLLDEAGQGESLVEILKSDEASRRSDLINSGGLNAIDPNNQLQNLIIQSDCDRILTFLTHQDKWHEKTSGRKILSAIQTFFKITSREIEDEKKALDSYNNDFEMIDDAQTAQPPSPVPAEFFRPENALLKLIYEKTLELKIKLSDEVVFSVSYPINSNSQHASVSRQYSSSGARTASTSARPLSSSQQSNASASSSRSASSSSPQFKFS